MEGYKFTAVVAIGLSGKALVELSSKEHWMPGEPDYLGFVGEDANDDVEQWMETLEVFTDVPGLYRIEAVATSFTEDDAPEYKLISQNPVHYDAGGDL